MLKTSSSRLQETTDKQVVDEYYSELLSFSLDRLNKEPELLKVEQDRLDRQLKETAVNHYRAFIDVSETLDTVHHQLHNMSDNIQKLLTDLPGLSEKCGAFGKAGTQVMAKKANNKKLLGQHLTLLDLLEIPQLMDTCVRNGNYDEALDLQGFASKMALLHSDVPVIKNLLRETEGVCGHMLEQLLQKLCGPIQLPECLQVIGFLRRLAVFDELELRQHFLRCRDTWLVQLIDDTEQYRQNPQEHIKKLTDVHRQHLFDVIMQYRAIFSDEDELSAGRSAGDSSVLHEWGQNRIGNYLGELAQQLPKVQDGSALAGLLDQCEYCGHSLGRVGLDFRGLLPPLFERCMRDLFKQRLQQSLNVFQQSLESHKWVSIASIGSKKKSAQQETGTQGGDSDDKGVLNPPYILMEHLPLAAFVNTLLTAFNELRHCAPSALSAALSIMVTDVLQQGAGHLRHYAALHALQERQLEVFLGACNAYVGVLIPFIAQCWGRIYSGGSQLIIVQQVVKELKEWLEEQQQQHQK
eukprot:TRINITY_DN59136_c2_g1_i2.p1 TRINITY_DN59136_c2_g1~~TRINITY_DN59136_c2_g1_i2.p1  ORF type:complete len:523 (+),score=67.84 TRINITY_DN59136_c2_g1_i2:41-1609(+)